MPVCKNCGKFFLNREIIDGQIVHLGKRKYCLECSPYKSGNRIKLENKNKNCIICGKSLIKNQQKYCSNKCKSKRFSFRRSDYYNKYRTILKRKMVEYKGGKCSICGYNKCLRALHFHHIDSSKKEFRLADASRWSWKKIVQELDKCILVCANCHAELHDEIENLKITQ